MGQAATGTGKTAAFALPILHRLAETARRPEPKSCRVLVLSPTRELASQIAQSFDAYGRFLKIRIQTVFGGVGFGIVSTVCVFGFSLASFTVVNRPSPASRPILKVSPFLAI